MEDENELEHGALSTALLPSCFCRKGPEKAEGSEATPELDERGDGNEAEEREREAHAAGTAKRGIDEHGGCHERRP